MQREHFASRLGFILVSAGCAVGIGNVWKFPYLAGQYGGAAFILIYLVFLVILGLPIMVCEFSVGRSSQKSVARSFDKLEPAGTRWHNLKLIGLIGNYMLMMFYTMVGGWMLYYCYLSAIDRFAGMDNDAVAGEFSRMLGQPGILTFWTVIVILLSFGICAIGLQNGVERLTKLMMITLLLLMGVLAVHSCTLPGADAGLRFYLVPDFGQMMEQGIGNVVFAAMSQAFFTLSLGIGAMAIFGSYLDKKRSIPGEAVSICALDTLVALIAGFIIIPACFAYNVEPGSGPSLIFITLPNIFIHMAGGRIWGTLFFLFLSFAALSTVIAVFENITSFAMDLTGCSRQKAVAVNIVAMILLSMPCVLGFNVLSGLQPLGEGSTIMDLEDFLVSNNFLPLGSLVYLFFCVRKNGWGWDNFTKEANAGDGMKFPVAVRFHMVYILPIIVVVIYLKGYYDMFAGKSPVLFGVWMCIALAILAYIGVNAFAKPKSNK